MLRTQLLPLTALALLAAAAPAQSQDMPPEHTMSHEDMAGMEGMEGMEGMAGMDHMAGHGLMWQHGPWLLMTHGTLNWVYDDQGSPRGGRQGFLSGMIMGSAERSLAGNDTLHLTAMLSPEPLMGSEGYPLLLAAGETADGRTLLVDRQHPHDLFIELSGRYSHALSATSGVWLYAGLPGQPAFGPAAFMHRESINDSPEAPIAHHWLDSTHVSFGVLTAGLRVTQWSLEASAFRGREPDQNRYDIETPRLDSWSARLSWQPTTTVALQTSWAQLHSPEALEPQRNERRWTASLSYTGQASDRGWWATTWAVGRKQPEGLPARSAWSAEASYHPNAQWSLYGRIEKVESDEWQPALDLQQAHKLTLGAVHDWPLGTRLWLGLGLQLAQAGVSPALRPAYGNHPYSGMGFLRLRSR
jgi:hypothetical protein